jgi:ketosteroid isomerase-like protein
MAKHSFTLGSPDEVEQAFYEAMQSGDIDRLMACWADTDDVVCVHPGGPRLLGLAAVRHAFELVLANGPVRVRLAKAHRSQHDGWAIHSVLEAVDLVGNDGPLKAWVLATNVYARLPQGWRMVVHHASPGQREEPMELHSAPSVLH